jgi:hypothetical protein
VIRYGIKKPVKLTKDEQILYLTRQGVNLDSIILVDLVEGFYDSLKDKKYCLDTYNFERKAYSVPQMRVYDKSGKIITGWQSCFGDIKFMNYFSTEIPYTKYQENLFLNKSLVFQNDKNLISDKDIAFDTTYNLTIFVLWAKHLGKFNKDFLMEVEKYKIKNKNISVRYIYANLDIDETY